MFTLYKKFFLHHFEVTPVYVVQDSKIVELFLEKENYIQLNDLIAKEISEIKIEQKLNVLNQNIDTDSIFEESDDHSDINEFIVDYVNYEIADTLCDALSYFKKARSLSNEEIKKLSKMSFYANQDELKLLAKFALDKDDLIEFFNPKRFYYFDSKEKKIKVESIAPRLELRKTEFGLKQSVIEVGFSIEAFGEKWTEDDLLFEKDKIVIDNLFTSQDDLVCAKISELEEQLEFFKKLETDGSRRSKTKAVSFQ